MVVSKPHNLKKTKTAAAIVVAFAAGAVGGRAAIPDLSDASDPLGGWHYADLPVVVCTAKDGENIARVVVRPDIITTSEQRVFVPEFRDYAAEWMECHDTAMQVAGSTYPAQDVCYRRDSVGKFTIDIEGRDVGVASEFPTCHIEAFRSVLTSHPIVNGVPQ